MIRLAITYFAIIFAIGFVLGTLRVILLVPAIGGRIAELLEIPIMLAAIYPVGGWIGRQAKSPREALIIGFSALAILLGAEILLAFFLFGKTPIDALFNKDPLSGTAYYLALLVYALAPWWLYRASR